jgi:NAD-dependent dihydropyrimidine dehydrogenase PreA subunit
VAYVIAAGCIDCKDGACVACCPVDCIYEGGRMFYIHPDECISCGICESVCPPHAIFADQSLPSSMQPFARVNREFFAIGTHPLGSPNGASIVGAQAFDHPLVATAPAA